MNNSELFQNQPMQLHFDRIRSVAACLVVLTHASAQWLDASCTLGMPALLFAQLCNIVSFAGITLFVMLSGAIYLAPSHKSKSCSVRVMSKRALRFLLLYSFWKLFYLAENLLLHPELLQQSSLKESLFLAFFRTNGKYHLWYLPMFSLFLILVPLLYEGAQRRGACILYLLLFILTAIILPNAFLYEFPFKYLLLDMRNLFDLNYFLGYLGYFLLGHVLAENVQASNLNCKMRHSIWISVFLWAGAALSLTVAILKSVSCSVGQTSAYTSLATPFSVHILLLAAAVFRLLCTSHKASLFSITFRLSKASFGIYLLHPFLLDLLQKTNLVTDAVSPLLGIPVLWLVLVTLSCCLSLFLKRLPLIRRLL